MRADRNFRGHVDSRTNSPKRTNPLASVASILGAIIGSFAIGILALWLLGRIASDRYAWSQWLLWIPTPMALAIALLGVMAALRPGPSAAARRRRVMAWACAAGAILIYFACIEHRFWRIGQPAADRASIRLVHWNSYQSPQSEPDDVIDFLRRAQADIIVLTDAGPKTWEALRNDPLNMGLPAQRFGPVGVISRLPVRPLHPPRHDDGIWMVMLEVDASDALGGALQLCLVDFPSEPSRPRRRMAKQARALLEQMNAPPAGRVDVDVAVGDFNMTRSSAALRAIFPDLRHAFAQAGRGYGASYPREFPLYHIDHVLLREGWRARRYKLIDAGVSRHRAQVVEIAAEAG